MPSIKKEILEKIKELNAEVNAQADLLFAASIKEFFENHPTVEAIRWDQYAPYFNDGDPCVFSVNEVTVLLSDKVGVEIDEDADEDDYDEDNFVYSYGLKDDKLEKAISELNDDFSEIEDFLEKKFGSDSRITINKSGEATIDECDHD